MAIAPELRAQILRLYQAELWRVGTIARQLHVHRDTVRQVLTQSCVLRTHLTPRPSQADAYLPFILETLTKFPTLTASRLYVMVRECGYLGGADYFRHFVARHRPRPVAEAYLRLRTLPGEQAQVDWAHCGHLSLTPRNWPQAASCALRSPIPSPCSPARARAKKTCCSPHLLPQTRQRRQCNG